MSNTLAGATGIRCRMVAWVFLKLIFSYSPASRSAVAA